LGVGEYQLCGGPNLWAAAAAQAKSISDSLLAAPMPYTCPGRLAQASGKLMGKVKAALVFTRRGGATARQRDM